MKSMQLYWLECEAADLPGHTDWLSREERLHFDTFRFQKRRDDWLLGRWTAKCAIATFLNQAWTPFAQITILSAESGAPVVTIRGSTAPVSLSISHRAGRGFAVVANPIAPVGADVELVEPHGQPFTDDYFTPVEREQLDHCLDHDLAASSTLIWSAKESALKLLQLGLRVDTRCVSINVSNAIEVSSKWKRFDAAFVDGRIYKGWWQLSGEWVRTQLGALPSHSPIELHLQAVAGPLVS